MPFAVELFFDPGTEQAVRAVWHTLAAVGLTTALPDLGSRPHVSLAVCPTLAPEPYQEVLAKFARAVGPLDLTLASVGTFPRAEGVVFLAPVVTRPLLGLHAALHRRLATRATSWPHYRPGRWVPHCAVATDLPPNESRPPSTSADGHRSPSAVASRPSGSWRSGPLSTSTRTRSACPRWANRASPEGDASSLSSGAIRRPDGML